MGKDIMVACDFPSAEDCLEFVEKINDEEPYLKVGMELFYAEGPEFVRKLKAAGSRIFLDLKLHDIPNTVKGGMASLARLGVDMTNLHAAGGKEMMRAALEGLTDEDGKRPLLIAVTQLTSTGDEMLRNELLIEKPMKDVVLRYALNAKEAGLDGVVCSPLEVPEIKAECGEDFLTITPGIRLPGDAKGDQVRVTTPEMACQLGSDYAVIGRSITKAEDPAAAFRRCRKDFTGA